MEKSKLNLLAIITFDRSDGFQSLRLCSRQPVDFHGPFVLKSCENYLSKSVNILFGEPVHIDSELVV